MMERSVKKSNSYAVLWLRSQCYAHVFYDDEGWNMQIETYWLMVILWVGLIISIFKRE